MLWIADLVGLSVLAAIVGCLAVLVPRSEMMDLQSWVEVYAALAIMGLFLWRGRSAPGRPKEWVYLLGFIVLADLLSFCIDAVSGGYIWHPEFSLIQAAMQFGGPFGFALTAFIIPMVFIVAVAGTVRSVFLNWYTHA